MIDFGYMTAKQLEAMGIVTPDRIVSATVRDMETLRRRYSQDPTQQALVDRINGEVDICANTIARACAQQTLRLFRIGGGSNTRKVSKTRAKAMARGEYGIKAQSLIESADEVTEVTDHPVLQFIRRPNPYYPGVSLEYMSFKFRCVNGEFYTFLTDDGRGGKIGWPGYPQFTLPVFREDEEVVDHYIFGRESARMVYLPPEQVIPWKNIVLNKSNPLRGEGEIMGVLADADLIQTTTLHDLAFMRNGARPDALISYTGPEPVQAEQLDGVYDTLSEWKVGGRREGMPFVGQYLDWKPLTWAPKDLLSEAKVEAARKMIRRACGIPESMADSNASTYAASLIADAQMGRVVLSKLQHDAAQKTEWLLPEFGLDPTRYAFAYDNPVPRDEAAEVTRLSNMVAMGGLTINEMRAELGYDAVDDPNADKLLYQGRPLAESAQPANPFGGLFSGSRPQADSNSELESDNPESPDSSPAASEDEEETKSAPPVVEAVDLKAIALAAESDLWKPAGCTCDACTKAAPFTDDFILALYAKFGPEFRATIEDIIADAQAESVRAFFDGERPDLTSFRDQAREVLSDQIRQIAEESLRREVQRLGLVDDFFRIVPERAVAFARNYSLTLADDIMGTTAEMAQQAVAAGIEQGMSIGRIQKEIEGVPEWRAEMIARTETARAMNGSRYDSFQAMGATHTEWVNGLSPCPICEGMAAKGPVKLYEPYALAGQIVNGRKVGWTVLYPPIHPNDRCVVEPLFPEDME